MEDTIECIEKADASILDWFGERWRFCKIRLLMIADERERNECESCDS